MKPQEARVLIIDDDPSKINGLTIFVCDMGGEVVATADSVESGSGLLGSPDFPSSAGNPNVVLIDGNLTEHSSDGRDGERIFTDGYQQGRLRRADFISGLGIVSIGCSDNPRSPIRYATGANFDLGLRVTDEDRNSWVMLLEPHTANPEVAPPNTLFRENMDGYGLDEIFKEFVGNNARLLYLHSTEEVIDGDQVTTNEYGSTCVPSTEDEVEVVTSDELLRRIDDMESVPPSEQWLRLNSTKTRIIVSHGSEINIIDFEWLKNKKALYRHDEFTSQARVDTIYTDRLHDVPQAYWDELGIDPITVLQVKGRST